MLKTVAITSGSGGGNGTVTNVATGTGLTGGPITTTGTIALANTAVTAGTYGSTSNVAQVTVNAQGQVTNVTNVAITTSTGTVTNVATGTGLTGGPVTTTGTISIANTTVTAGTYGNASTVAQVTINAQGQATNVVNVAISIANSAVTGLGTMATQNANAVVVTGGSINNTAIGNATANTGVFTTLTNTGTAYLGGASGNQSLQVNNVASAVNYAQIVGAVTGGSPSFSAQGTDANIALGLFQKGTGDISIGGSFSNASLLISTPVGTVNSFQLFGNSTGNGVSMNAVGADSNIPLTITAKGTSPIKLQTGTSETFRAGTVGGNDFTNYYTSTGYLNYTAAGGSSNINFYFGAKGTGSIQLASGGGTQAVVSNTASAVNYLQLTGAATGAAPTFSVAGSDANISLTLTTKGTGIVQTAATLKYAGVIAGLSTKTAAYTLVATDYTVLGNATTASFSLTLPTSVGATGQVYIIKKVDSTANTVTILTTSSQTIDGSTSKVLSYQYDGFQLQSDGANWMIIGNIFGRNGTTGTF